MWWWARQSPPWRCLRKRPSQLSTKPRVALGKAGQAPYQPTRPSGGRCRSGRRRAVRPRPPGLLRLSALSSLLGFHLEDTRAPVGIGDLATERRGVLRPQPDFVGVGVDRRPRIVAPAAAWRRRPVAGEVVVVRPGSGGGHKDWTEAADFLGGPDHVGCARRLRRAGQREAYFDDAVVPLRAMLSATSASSSRPSWVSRRRRRQLETAIRVATLTTQRSGRSRVEMCPRR